MSAKERYVRITFQVHHSPLFLSSLPKRRAYTHSSQTLISFNIIHFHKTPNPQIRHSSSSTDFDYLNQFSPFCNSNKAAATDSLNFINSNERRRITVGLSKIIKLRHEYLLRGFSDKFCPYFIVRIMNLLGTRETAFAFFKFVFRDDSESTIRSCCTVAHILAAQNLRVFAQDVVSWVIKRIGESRSEDLVEFMWGGHHKYESDFSVLDTLMRAFLIVDMGSRALDILSRMREVGVRPSSSAMTILFEFLLRVGDYGSVWKLFREMIREGPHPSNYTFNAMILGFCRKGHLRIGESLLNVMGKFKCNPDVYAYNIVINANFISGRTLNALAWVHLMIERGCKPSIITFNTIVNALCSEGNVVEARKVFDEIQEMGLSPNVAICNTLINGYVKARDVGQANMLYEEMRSKGINPDAITFNILIVGHFKYGREEDGDRLLRELSVMDLLPDHSLIDISVGGLCWAGHLDEVMEFLENMLEKGMTPNVVAFNSVIAAYSRAGLEDDAYKIYKLMMKFSLMAFIPNVITTNVLLSHFCKQGMPKRALMWCQKLSEISFEFDEVSYKIMDQAYLNIQEGVEFFRATSGKSLLLEFLMYITYDYFSRSRLKQKTSP